MCEIFEQTFLPKSLTDLNIFMFGCNNNSDNSDNNNIILECVKRKCKSFVGFDKNNEIIQKLKSQHSNSVLDNISFVYDDLEDHNKIVNVHGQCDLVFYNTLYNSYINNDKMHDLLATITKDVLIYKSNLNVNMDCNQFMSIMRLKGFEMTISITKNIFIMKKFRDVYKIRWKNVIYDHIISKYYDYIVTENFPFCNTTDKALLKLYKEEELQVQRLYNKIKHIKYVADITFINSVSFTKFYNTTLINKEKTPEWINMFKTQLIDLVREMNKAGVAHRDMHVNNICVEDEIIKLIDFEYLCENICDLRDCYDLTGIDCFVRTNYKGHMHIFKQQSNSLSVYLNNQITLDNFVTM